MHDFQFDGDSNVFIICHHFHNIQCRNMHDFDLDLNNEPRSDVSMPFDSSYITSNIKAIPTCTMYAIVCKIIGYELPKYRGFESLTFKRRSMQ